MGSLGRPPVRESGAAIPSQTTWAIDPGHTRAEFTGRHLTVVSVRGRFVGVRGEIVEHHDDLPASSVSVDIDATTLWSGLDKRDESLRGPDFLDVERYPQITFRSTRVVALAPDHFTVLGTLTVRDVARPIALDVQRNGDLRNLRGTLVAGFTARTTVDRRDFGMTWNRELPGGGWLTSHEIDLELEVFAAEKG